MPAAGPDTTAIALAIAFANPGAVMVTFDAPTPGRWRCSLVGRDGRTIIAGAGGTIAEVAASLANILEA